MKTEYCTDKLTEEKYQAFVYAVKNHYWYQMYIDDLPIWGRYQCTRVFLKLHAFSKTLIYVQSAVHLNISCTNQLS